MDERKDSSTGESAIFGTGEFQLRGVHVVARVQLQDGVVREIEFQSLNGQPISEAEQMARQLRGQPLSRALEVKAKEVDAIDEPGESVAKVALLEAFHRAVEFCLDSQ